MEWKGHGTKERNIKLSQRGMFMIRLKFVAFDNDTYL